MFKSARWRLTLIYSLLFLCIFAIFSIAVYIWMDRSLGENYISRVKGQKGDAADHIPKNTDPDKIISIAGEVAQDRLKIILISLDGFALIFIPFVGYFIAGKTLSPIEEDYERQKRFVSDASHELRTPLTIMQGELDLALKNPRSQSEYKDALINTRVEVQRLHQLTNALLTIARNDQNDSILKEKVDINDLLIEVTNTFENLASKKNVTLILDQSQSNQTLNGDKLALHQLFSNLIDNAIKYTPEDGKVNVSIYNLNKNVVVKITDDGPGMNENEITNVFDRFYKGDSSRNSEGFGLGLAICRSIAQSHRANIKITNNSPSGLVVRVSFPN